MERCKMHSEFLSETERKKPLGIPRIHRRRWEDNIKMFLEEIVCKYLNSIELTLDRVQL
jgi:hypothetical protein